MQIYELAHLLHVSIHDVYDMDYDEYTGWLEYFQRRPIGWRDDLRASYIMNAQGVKKKPEEIFPSIANVKRDEVHSKNRTVSSKGRADSRDFHNSSFFNLLRSKTNFNPEFQNQDEEE